MEITKDGTIVPAMLRQLSRPLEDGEDEEEEEEKTLTSGILANLACHGMFLVITRITWFAHILLFREREGLSRRTGRSRSCPALVNVYCSTRPGAGECDEMSLQLVDE
jgi:hypothetical protein